MKKLDCYISNNAPNVRNSALWFKPTEDGFIAYLLDGGFFKPLKLVNDNQTRSTSDDKPKECLKVTDITKLTTKQCNALNVGDQVIKSTGTQRHLYTVTYKDETGGGMCLGYVDAENSETVAYDREGKTWSYTDTVITPLGS